MGEVKRFIAEVDSGFSVKRCEVVLATDYATLEAKYSELREVAIKLEQANAGIAQLNGSMRSELVNLRAAKAQLLDALDSATHYMELMQNEIDGLINYAGGTGGFGEYNKHIESARAAHTSAQKGKTK